MPDQTALLGYVPASLAALTGGTGAGYALGILEWGVIAGLIAMFIIQDHLSLH